VTALAAPAATNSSIDDVIAKHEREAPPHHRRGRRGRHVVQALAG